MQLKLLKPRGFRFLATEDTKCHSWIFSIFLNVSLPLVVCTAQKTILTNKHKTKWKKEACPMNYWKRFWKTVHQLSCTLPYIISILHWFLWKPNFFDKIWIWIILVWISNYTVSLKSLNHRLFSFSSRKLTNLKMYTERRKIARKLVLWKAFHQQPKYAHKLNNDHKSLSYRPSSYFVRKNNAFRPQRRILLQEISMTS